MVSRKKRTELDTWSEVKESIAHVDTVSARISRMLTELGRGGRAAGARTRP